MVRWATSKTTSRRARLRASKPKVKPPTLNATLRSLWLKVHPDRMERFPEQRDKNEDSLQALNGFLSSIKKMKPGEFPPMKVTRLQFYLLRSLNAGTSSHGATADDALEEVELVLRTNGGDCKGPLERQLGIFFRRCGLPPRFDWGPEYWQYPHISNLAEYDAEQKEAARKAREE